MDKKIILAFLLLFFCACSFAENCPSINDIKHRLLSGLKAYDSEEGTPISTKREARFRNSIEQFALAEWGNANNTKSTIHCYYRDNTGSALEVYLAKDNFAPNNHKHYWYDVSGFMHCAAGIHQCEFVTLNKFKKQQLATK